ncbi:Oidioi.mRNA.OKI2018_I69.chr2.g5778.t1.cds [Oikopleura dioica]|uniref:Oidioi.mRNA.OKI2018_I69.chr2.g5778.t1.cds n=1 Tax=Oikopleura dioica TaxID=34765 RepID=A0ABN7T5R5_OIKDI|nr:Oidioi.mRNA.OKI2018_I69.chr2.g5778.t1.cds [Oikopleura dioica]
MFDVQQFIKDAFDVDVRSRIAAKCRYNTEVALDDVIASNTTKVNGNSVTKYGSMRPNFAINTFEDSSFRKVMDNNTAVFIGQEIFLQVEWVPAQRIGQLHFAIDSCGVTFRGHEILMPLVVDNCYSKLFDARILSNHLERKKARFSYRLFSIVNSRRNSATMHCKLRLCNKKDFGCLSSSRTEDCPKTDAFDFSIDGN